MQNEISNITSKISYMTNYIKLKFEKYVYGRKITGDLMSGRAEKRTKGPSDFSKSRANLIKKSILYSQSPTHIFP